ncbi:MAG: enoyl-CoA hydratase/isomerase family protein [Rhodanobacteraceae bacterium]
MLNIIDHQDIRELQLARAPVNALNPTLVQVLRQAVETAPNEGAQGIILSGGEKVFSAGLDLPELLALDRDAMHDFWAEFFRLCAALARSPVPVVAAIGGHSPAGGAVLAIMCDYRVMAHGPFRIGLNETQVGLSVPDCIQLALRRLVGRYPAERLLVAGTMLESEQARKIGLVDELASVEQVRQRAMLWMRELLKLPRRAMLETRAMARADLTGAFADLDALPVNDFLNGWFHPETQAVLQQVVAQLKSRSKSG